MKFLIVMLLIRLVISAVKNREKKVTLPEMKRELIPDPAEFPVR